MPRNVFHGDRIFDGQPVGLAFDARLVDENATICCETYMRNNMRKLSNCGRARGRVSPNTPANASAT